MSLAIKEKIQLLTEAEYLRSEAVSAVKREFIDGQVYAMAGAWFNHNCIAGNVYRKFGNHLEGSRCTPFMSDMKVRLGKDYVYPDVLVDCGNLGGEDYFSTAPVIIVEVLSKSTRKTDSTLKLLRYINMESVQEYVLIEQDFVSVQILRRANRWLSEYYFLGDSVHFASIYLTLSVAEIYDRVDNTDMREFRLQLEQGDVANTVEPEA